MKRTEYLSDQELMELIRSTEEEMNTNQLPKAPAYLSAMLMERIKSKQREGAGRKRMSGFYFRVGFATAAAVALAFALPSSLHDTANITNRAMKELYQTTNTVTKEMTQFTDRIIVKGKSNE